MNSKVKSSEAFTNSQGEVVWNTFAGSIVMDENSGKERLQISHITGDNLNFNNKGISLLATNNKQENILGDNFSTTKGDSFVMSQSNKEERTFGDFTLIAGNPGFFTQPLAAKWLQTYQPVAAAKTNPEFNVGGVGVNTNIEFIVDGTPSESGAVEGGSYSKNTSQENAQSIMEDAASKLANIETDMGVGGNIKLLTTKNFVLKAGTGTVATDPGIMISNAKEIDGIYFIKDGKAVEQKTSTSVFEEKDTANGVPFGDVHINAGTKVRVTAGSGGVNIKSAGNSNITSTGRTIIGGAEVSIGGGTSQDSGRVTIITDKDVFTQSGVIITFDAPVVKTNASEQYSIKSPQTVIDGNLHIEGDLHVTGSIIADKDITAGGRGGVSLLKHTHKVAGVETGGGNVTSDKPK